MTTGKDADLLSVARSLLAAGLCPLPAVRKGDAKRVALASWKPYQTRLPTDDELVTWFDGGRGESICIVCGGVSGNLEMIDFDLGAVAFDAWCRSVEDNAPGLLARLVIETTPSGGRHVVYRSAAPVCGNLKLAKTVIESEDGEATVHHGKTFTPRQDAGGRWSISATTIETRGEGGLFLCDPSPGYEVVQGRLAEPPIVTEYERDVLLGAAYALDEGGGESREPEREATTPQAEAPGLPGERQGLPGERPGDDFNRRGDVRAVLRRHGWELVKPGDNEHWRRPGKTDGMSATLKDRVFYVFSSNAPPFEPHTAYSPFRVLALLEHHGDFEAAASALAAEGFGSDLEIDDGVDISGILARIGTRSPVVAVSEPGRAMPRQPRPEPTPVELLRVPGFVSEVMDYTLATSHYPNQAMAFCAALALQSFLAGRKVMDAGGSRTNLYILGLAYSGSGKDRGRKVNARILHGVGLGAALGEKIASSEGLEDALSITPAMLFQMDEMDGMLQSINLARDPRFEAIVGSLLTLYTNSSSFTTTRRKALKKGGSEPAVIDQPSLTLFGTATPDHWYGAMSERLLTNGFMSRMLVIEGGKRAKGQDPQDPGIPERIMLTAKAWAETRLGAGNLSGTNPMPRVVPTTDEAAAAWKEIQATVDAEWEACEERRDKVGTTIWSRVFEQAKKLALVYAVSESKASPRVTSSAVAWAADLMTRQARLMIDAASKRIATSPFDAEVLRFKEAIQRSPDGAMRHMDMLRLLRVEAKRLREIVDTLSQREEITVERSSTNGRGGLVYRLT